MTFLLFELIDFFTRVKSGNFLHQVNSDSDHV